MADQKNRGGQKLGNAKPGNDAEQKQGTTKEGQRSEEGKRHDQKSNPDDARRRPPNEQD